MHPAHNGRNSLRGLSSITIGLLDLVPEFDNGTLEYTVNTSNASNKVTVVPVNEDSEVTIINNDVNVTNGTSANWRTGYNYLHIFVDDIEYIVIVNRG